MTLMFRLIQQRNPPPPKKKKRSLEHTKLGEDHIQVDTIHRVLQPVLRVMQQTTTGKLLENGRPHKCKQSGDAEIHFLVIEKLFK